MKSRFAWYLIVYVYVALFSLLIASYGYADELLFKFKSPSFSGINSSSHYLTIENQENTRRGTIKQEREAELDAIKREENNSTLARFMRNFESRVYAQLSRQLVEQLFGENPIDFNIFADEDDLKAGVIIVLFLSR